MIFFFFTICLFKLKCHHEILLCVTFAIDNLLRNYSGFWEVKFLYIFFQLWWVYVLYIAKRWKRGISLPTLSLVFLLVFYFLVVKYTNTQYMVTMETRSECNLYNIQCTLCGGRWLHLGAFLVFFHLSQTVQGSYEKNYNCFKDCHSECTYMYGIEHYDAFCN